jgi:hypothetical protein
MSGILLKRVVSGGQAGVDRAALDAAAAMRFAQGGWCPNGRLAEDGPIPGHYPLKETPTGDFSQRTEWNVRDSDATLILSPQPLEGGTRLTERLARGHEKPCLALDPSEPAALQKANTWLERIGPATLNVAGPRASRWADGYAVSFGFLCALLKKAREKGRA